jgi:xanthine dehydrogenase accessory factor
MKTATTAAEVATDWLAAGRRVVAATLVERIGSAPFDPGAEMVVDDRGRLEGTVTGGCVESALVAEAEAVLAGGGPKLVRYGVSDEQAFEVGLMCGGEVAVYVHEIGPAGRPALEAVAAARAAGEPAALATLLSGAGAGAKLAILGDGTAGGLGIALLDHNVERESRGFLEEGVSRIRGYGAGGEVMGDELDVCIQAFQTRPEMMIYGAIDYSVALARLAAELGYRVTICDARPAFAAGRRFEEVAEVIVDWPDRDLAQRRLGPRDAVLVFTHDPKFDQPALLAALRSEAGYVGALGSRRTQGERIERLRAAGVGEADLERLHAPCGLDLGARTPEETAVSILAEIVAARTGRGGERLTETSGPIHVEAGDQRA